MNTRHLMIAIAFAVTCAAASGAVVTLLDEEFTNGSGPANTATATWTTTDANGFEVYDNAGFGARGITGGIPASPLGGLAVLNNDTDTTITISVSLPALLDDTLDGTLTFLSGNGIGGGFGGLEGTLEIINISDNRVIRPTGLVSYASFVLGSNTVNIDFLPADAGDTLELRFSESAGANDRGLQLADLQLDVTIVPEPSAVTVVGLVGLGLLRRRRR